MGEGGAARHAAKGPTSNVVWAPFPLVVCSGRHGGVLRKSADQESTDGRAARYVAAPVCTGIYGFVASPGAGLCRPVPGRVGPRQDRRSRIDHVRAGTDVVLAKL